MPVQQIVVHISDFYWYSLTAASWPNLTSVVDGRGNTHVQNSVTQMARLCVYRVTHM
jgi:hypothetical protein